MSKVPLLACASLLALCACATAAPQAAGEAKADRADGTAYGRYLAGRAALNAGANTEAADYFASVARDSGNQAASDQAFLAAVLSGDMDRAAALVPKGADASPEAARLGRLVSAVEALAKGHARQAETLLSGEPIGFPHRVAAALLKPWAAAAAGDWATATGDPELISDRLAYSLGTLSRAELLERQGRLAEAEAAFKAQASGDDAADMFVQAYGEFLERRGRRADAVALYDEALAHGGAGAGVEAARARAAAGRPAPAMPTLRQGAAGALANAAAVTVLAKQPELAQVYLRLSLRLEPTDTAWLMLGDTLAVGQQPDEARAAYAHVGPRSPSFVDARVRIIWTLQAAGQEPEALTLAQETAKLAPDDETAQTTLADALRANKQFAQSAAVMDGLIGDGRKADWRLYYLRAMALDKAGRWSDAERDLSAGLALKPDEPELLNYLGYAWIDRGENLTKALAMVQKAAAAEPNSGAVVDSLGWAYFRLGDFAKAVEQLERAAQLEPSDAEINNHLGDAYWRSGRRVEAEFQWRKVLTTMEPEPDLKRQIEDKLKSGLQAPPTPNRVAAR